MPCITESQKLTRDVISSASRPRVSWGRTNYLHDGVTVPGGSITSSEVIVAKTQHYQFIFLYTHFSESCGLSAFKQEQDITHL